MQFLEVEVRITSRTPMLFVEIKVILILQGAVPR
jgi:hypothetical protein